MPCTRGTPVSARWYATPRGRRPGKSPGQPPGRWRGGRRRARAVRAGRARPGEAETGRWRAGRPADNRGDQAEDDAAVRLREAGDGGRADRGLPADGRAEAVAV